MNDINLFKSKDSLFLIKISNKSQISNIQNCDGYLIESSESEARRIIESLKKSNKIIAFAGGDDALNRRAIETLKINYLISPEKKTAKDTLKQRDSGLNHVTAKEAKKKNITIIINASEISILKGKEKAIQLSKIIQNIKICRKANCNIKIASIANNNKEIIDEKSRKAFGVSLGMGSQQSKECAEF